MFLPAQEEPNAASSEAPDALPKSPKARQAQKTSAVTSHENQEKKCDFFWKTRKEPSYKSVYYPPIAILYIYLYPH